MNPKPIKKRSRTPTPPIRAGPRNLLSRIALGQNGPEHEKLFLGKALIESPEDVESLNHGIDTVLAPIIEHKGPCAAAEFTILFLQHSDAVQSAHETISESTRRKLPRM